MKINKKGFSMLEIAMVLIVVSLITGAVLGSRSIIDSANLSNAQNLTANSPVLSMDGLIFWVETSMDSRNVEIGDRLETWEDSSSLRSNAEQTTEIQRPMYFRSRILPGLESIYFNDSDVDPEDPDIIATNNILNAVKYTAFIVFNMDEYTNTGGDYYFHNGDNSGDGWGLTVAETTHASVPFPRVATVIYNGTNKVIRLNKIQTSSSAVSKASNIKSGFYIGGREGTTDYIEGGISEIIIFNRALFQREFEEVETYLYKKYSLDN